MSARYRIRRQGPWWQWTDTTTGDQMLCQTWAHAIEECSLPVIEPVPEVPVADDLVSPGYAARLLGVSTVTLVNWSDAGRLHPVRPPGGHRRYRRREVVGLAMELRRGEVS